MGKNTRTRFTPKEAMYYLKARPQFRDLSDQHLSAAIDSVVSSSHSKELTLVNLARIEHSLSTEPFCVGF